MKMSAPYFPPKPSFNLTHGVIEPQYFASFSIMEHGSVSFPYPVTERVSLMMVRVRVLGGKYGALIFIYDIMFVIGYYN